MREDGSSIALRRPERTAANTAPNAPVSQAAGKGYFAAETMP